MGNATNNEGVGKSSQNWKDVADSQRARNQACGDAILEGSECGGSAGRGGVGARKAEREEEKEDEVCCDLTQGVISSEGFSSVSSTTSARRSQCSHSLP